MNNNLRIAVLYGGESGERAVSLQSGQGVAAWLTEAGFSAVSLVDLPTEKAAVQWVHQTMENQDVDLAFLVLHGGMGEDGRLQSLLELAGIAYTGASAQACHKAMDKSLTKLIWQAQGFPVPQGRVVDISAQSSPLPYPVFVKPLNQGSSLGMSPVHHHQAWQQAMDIAAPYGNKVLVEDYIAGRELTVSILGDRALPIIEIKTSSDFYDYHAKYHADDTQYLCPAPVDANLSARIQHTCLAAFAALGGQGWGRVDVLLKGEEFFLIELNTAPGMTDHSLFPMAARAAGLTLGQALSQICQLGLTRA